MTPAEIASMVADIDELEADTPLTILSHVRALAAELTKCRDDLVTESVNCDNLTNGAYELSGRVQELERENFILQTALNVERRPDWQKNAIDRPANVDLSLRDKLEAVTRERDEWRASHKLLEHKIITCGVAASHPDASLSHRGAYAEKWDSQQAQEVRKLRAERDRYKAALENINRISGPNVARDVVREALKGAE